MTIAQCDIDGLLCATGYYQKGPSLCERCPQMTDDDGYPLWNNTEYEDGDDPALYTTAAYGATSIDECDTKPLGTYFGHSQSGYFTYEIEHKTTQTYTACKANYYLNDNTCMPCSAPMTTPDKNTATQCSCATGYKPTTQGSCEPIIYEIEYAPHSSSPDACVLPSDLEPTSVRALDLANRPALPTAVNSRGCTFGGWYTTSNGSDKVDEINILTDFSTGRATFYGKLTANTYTIKLDNNDGSGDSVTIKEVYGTKWTNSSGTTTISSISIPTRSGYNFNGYWSETSGGNQYIGSNGVLPSNTTIFASNTTLYAQWINECDIGYYMDSDTCKPCPEIPGYYTDEKNTTKAYGTTTGTGATSINECIMSADTTYWDDIGSFKLESNCSYVGQQ